MSVNVSLSKPTKGFSSLAKITLFLLIIQIKNFEIIKYLHESKFILNYIQQPFYFVIVPTV